MWDVAAIAPDPPDAVDHPARSDEFAALTITLTSSFVRSTTTTSIFNHGLLGIATVVVVRGDAARALALAAYELRHAKVVQLGARG